MLDPVHLISASSRKSMKALARMSLGRTASQCAFSPSSTGFCAWSVMMSHRSERTENKEVRRSGRNAGRAR